MPVRVSLTHRTTYRYERPAELGPQIIRLRPAPHNRTPIHTYSLRLKPERHFLNWQQDAYGNYLARVVVPDKAPRFEVLVNLVADLQAYNPFDFFLESGAEEFPFAYGGQDLENLETYLKPDPVTPLLSEFIARVDRTKRRTVDFLVELNRKVHEAVAYVIRLEPGVQTPEDTLKIGRGSCRDSAWLFVQVCRNLGLAARFVSGYLIQLTPDERPLEGPQGPERDFTDLHAWAEVYAPGAGWIGLDATSGLLVAEGHIPLACTPRPSSAAPVSGMVQDVETEFDFEMSVSRVVDVPRVTKPYSDDEWSAIVARGSHVDEVLERNDVRLTMGGEPTFVGIDNPDAPEWNTQALGKEKLRRANGLGRRLQQLWAPGGAIHHGHGKWYPGEALPRWAITIISRTDGEPVWKDVKWFASADEDLGHTTEHAARFIRTLGRVLAVHDQGVMPVYEDAWYHLWRERRLPVNVDPLESKLDDPLERERLARVFRSGLNEPSGYVMPLGHDGQRFVSGRWFVREEHCFLHPGDFPIGYRLPLESLPWHDPTQDDAPVMLDPSVPREPLPQFQQLLHRLNGPFVALDRAAPITHQGRSHGGSDDGLLEKKGEPEGSQRKGQTGPDDREQRGADELPLGPVKTALCTEVRGGVLHVFLPPTYSTEAFLQLLAGVEQTCEITGHKVKLEGYGAPKDPRLTDFKLTPDPGVLEVNVPPTRSWNQLLQQNEQLYTAAREERLTAEKFDLDGKHIGSGGGNHLVLGATTPLESVFLRRPDVLVSLISFWHNHPALSFLFSGQFIGPTSQAPRVDEARNDSVYELELAFDELLRHQNVQPWLVDRVLRNLLVDVTGNTHRTEFCIDKLYSPDLATGRLGLVEMRAFEMPPHFKMASAQHLLVRSIVAAFSERPYKERLVKWGTSLHDRFMLPHFVKHDLIDALRFLEERGFGLDPQWFEPHYQFRFPYYGEIARDDVHLEVRGALEPWHVLGEESAAAGQTRYVDSSLERIQVKVKGVTFDRYLVCCNSVALPLHPTGTRGEFIAGVRYRAWQPPFCLHPTIGVHGPLHLDLYDRWNQRAIAGCTYHVVHPGGRANADRPINAVAAESRRIARFDESGHTPRSYTPQFCGVNSDFPMTLDLRRVSF